MTVYIRYFSVISSYIISFIGVFVSLKLLEWDGIRAVQQENLKLGKVIFSVHNGDFFQNPGFLNYYIYMMFSGTFIFILTIPILLLFFSSKKNIFILIYFLTNIFIFILYQKTYSDTIWEMITFTAPTPIAFLLGLYLQMRMLRIKDGTSKPE